MKYWTERPVPSEPSQPESKEIMFGEGYKWFNFKINKSDNMVNIGDYYLKKWMTCDEAIEALQEAIEWLRTC